MIAADHFCAVVVSDDRICLESIRRALVPEGHVVVHVADVSRELSLLVRAIEIDLIVLDVDVAADGRARIEESVAILADRYAGWCPVVAATVRTDRESLHWIADRIRPAGILVLPSTAPQIVATLTLEWRRHPEARGNGGTEPGSVRAQDAALRRIAQVLASVGVLGDESARHDRVEDG